MSRCAPRCGTEAGMRLTAAAWRSVLPSGCARPALGSWARSACCAEGRRQQATVTAAARTLMTGRPTRGIEDRSGCSFRGPIGVASTSSRPWILQLLVPPSKTTCGRCRWRAERRCCSSGSGLKWTMLRRRSHACSTRTRSWVDESQSSSARGMCRSCGRPTSSAAPLWVQPCALSCFGRSASGTPSQRKRQRFLSPCIWQLYRLQQSDSSSSEIMSSCDRFSRRRACAITIWTSR
mmetsp:Transcript_139148/g.444576  ORF Transcript_139148/g.444576 Transcript_139148/m.444576 type:complete len:236 (-) Transcript_139148:3026-3733(-)